MASTYDKEILSAEDYEEVVKQGKAWSAANKAGDTEGKASAAARAEAIRSAYGYSGGDDGQRYIPLEGYEGAEKMHGAATDYDAAYEGINDVYKAQAEASKEDIEKQKTAALKQAYIGNMMDRKNIDQQMRAGGMTGGLSESSRVALQNNYRTNRNATENAAMQAARDVDLNLQQNLAQNELSRAGTKYNSEVANAQFQNAAAANNRNIKLTERQLEQTEEQTNLSKYMTFMQNGWVDDKNAGQIATALGVSEETVKKAASAVNDGNYQSMALSLLSSGVYDDSFVDLFGGRFSAETLQAFAAQNKPTSSGGSSTSSYSTGKYVGTDEGDTAMSEYAAVNGYGTSFNDQQWRDAADYFGISINDIKNQFKQLERSNRISNSGVIPGESSSNVKGYTYDQIVAYADNVNYGKDFTDSEWNEAAADLGVTVQEMKNMLNSIKRIRGIK